MEMFEKAVRNKIRFNYKGTCSVEDLWDLNLTALDSIYKEVNTELKAQTEESLLGTKNRDVDMLELKIEIIKHIVTTKQAENEARRDAAKKSADKQELLALIEEKKKEGLRTKSVEELTKMVEEM